MSPFNMSRKSISQSGVVQSGLSRSGRFIGALVLSAALVSVSSCSSSGAPEAIDSRPTIVVSHVLLGSVAQEIVGPEADVVVLIPNGVDPHLYEPSARDIERLNNADLVVINGLGLESSLEESLAGARAQQTPIFVATDHIDTHEAPKNHDHSESELHEGEVESDQHADEKVVGEHDGHLHSEDDPHFWTDPRLMAEVAQELGDAVTDLGLDIGDRALMLSERLLTFDQDMLRLAETLPVDRRVLVTGHESLGYFAERYGFEIIGTIIPGLTTGVEVSAANLAAVKDAIVSSGVGVIFTELGTSSSSARVLSDELGVDVVEISTHFIPEEALELGMGGDTYMKFIEMLVNSIVSALEK